MKNLLVFSIIFLSLMYSCSINPEETVNVSDSTEVTPEINNNLLVEILSAKYENDFVQPGIKIKWTKLPSTLYYIIYYESGSKLDYTSNNMKIDYYLDSALISDSKLSGNKYLVSVVAVTSSYQTGLGNQKNVTY